MKIGETLVNAQGNKLTVLKWIPGNGVFVIGKWLLRNEQGKLYREYTTQLQKQGYKSKEAR